MTAEFFGLGFIQHMYRILIWFGFNFCARSLIFTVQVGLNRVEIIFNIFPTNTVQVGSYCHYFNKFLLPLLSAKYLTTQPSEWLLKITWRFRAAEHLLRKRRTKIQKVVHKDYLCWVQGVSNAVGEIHIVVLVSKPESISRSLSWVELPNSKLSQLKWLRCEINPGSTDESTAWSLLLICPSSAWVWGQNSPSLGGRQRSQTRPGCRSNRPGRFEFVRCIEVATIITNNHQYNSLTASWRASSSRNLCGYLKWQYAWLHTSFSRSNP